MRRLWCLVLLVGCSSEPRPEHVWWMSGTTWSPGPQGAKALYLLFDRMDLNVSRLDKPEYETLPSNTAVWILQDVKGVRRVAAARLAAFVQNGGTVVAPAITLRAILREIDPEPPEIEEHSTEVRTVWEKGLGTVPWTGIELSREPERVFAESSKGEPVVAAWRVGKGRLVLLGLVDRTRNEEIDARAAVLFVRTAKELGAKTHVFDEFHSGYAQPGSVAGLLNKAPYRAGVYQAALALLVGLLALGLRRLPAEPPTPLRRRATLEHLEAVALLWRRAGDAGLALRAVLRGVGERARLRLGGGDPAEAFPRWIARFHPNLADAASTVWRRCNELASKRPTTAEARGAAAEVLALERKAMRK